MHSNVSGKISGTRIPQNHQQPQPERQMNQENKTTISSVRPSFRPSRSVRRLTPVPFPTPPIHEQPQLRKTSLNRGFALKIEEVRSNAFLVGDSMLFFPLQRRSRDHVIRLT